MDLLYFLLLCRARALVSNKSNALIIAVGVIFGNIFSRNRFVTWYDVSSLEMKFSC